MRCNESKIAREQFHLPPRLYHLTSDSFIHIRNVKVRTRQKISSIQQQHIVGADISAEVVYEGSTGVPSSKTGLLDLSVLRVVQGPSCRASNEGRAHWKVVRACITLIDRFQVIQEEDVSMNMKISFKVVKSKLGRHNCSKMRESDSEFRNWLEVAAGNSFLVPSV